jgi:hypothetical protein
MRTMDEVFRKQGPQEQSEGTRKSGLTPCSCAGSSQRSHQLDLSLVQSITSLTLLTHLFFKLVPPSQD